MRISVLGSGGWGTALAMLLLKNGHDVTLWSYTEDESKTLRSTMQNPYLPEVELPSGLEFSADISCVRHSSVVVFATPSFAVRETAKKAAKHLKTRNDFDFCFQRNRKR